MIINKSPLSCSTIYTTVNGIIWDHSGEESKGDTTEVQIMYTNNKDLESMSLAVGTIAIQIPMECIDKLREFFNKECKK
jgi:hypothetical protein